jgi:hypothetical protein
MEFSQSLPRALAYGLAAVLSLNVAAAQPAKQTAKEPAKAEAKAKAEEFVPQSGQAGKDVVWVPTPQALVDRMLDMARVTKDDYVIDLGSGDGRTVITAGKRGVKAKGIEYNPDMVELSKRNAQKEGVNVEFVRGDIFESDFSDATVVTLFLLPSLNVRLRPILLDMKPGTRVVSNSFDMGDWTPDEQIQAGGDCSAWCRANFWVIPAKVEGVWQTPIGEMKLEQKYQMVSGTLKIGEATAPVTGKLVGADIVLTAGRNIFTGKVDGAKMEGTNVDSGKESKWTVTRGAK